MSHLLDLKASESHKNSFLPSWAHNQWRAWAPLTGVCTGREEALWRLADSQACGQVTASEVIRVWLQFFKGAATVLILGPMKSSGLL